MDGFTREMIKRAAARQSSHLICLLINDFIPKACQRDVWHKLEEAFYNDGMELTTIQQRLEMEELRISAGLTTPNPPLMFPNLETKK
jgi:hypothetical protein